MSTFQNLRDALDELVIAERIEQPHSLARDEYHLASATAKDAAECERVWGDYYGYHYSRCVSHGGRLPDYEAVQRAKRLIENQYRRRNRTILNAVRDCIEGRNGGMSQMLDYIRDGLKNEAMENFIAEVVDRHVAIDSFSQKVALIKEIYAEYGHLLPARNRNRPAEELAADYREVLRSLTDALRDASEGFRRS